MWISRGALGLCLVAGSASGQSARPSDKSDRAISLFREARKLQSEGRFSLACEKFQQSLALDRSPGTLLNLGSCRKGEGDLLAAIETFRLAAQQAARRPEGRKRELWLAAAKTALATLESRVARIELSLPGGGEIPSSWQASMDGKHLPAASDNSLLQNPGRHRLEVTAPGRQPYVREFELSDGEVLHVEVSLQLSDAPPTSSQNSAASALVNGPSSTVPADRADTESVLPVSLTLMGGVAVLAGGAAGLVSWSKTNELRDQCNPGCPPEPLSEAQQWSDVSNVLVGTGAVLGAIGGIWWWLDSSSNPRATSIGSFEKSTTSVSAVCSNFQNCALEVTGVF